MKITYHKDVCIAVLTEKDFHGSHWETQADKDKRILRARGQKIDVLFVPIAFDGKFKQTRVYELLSGSINAGDRTLAEINYYT